MQTRFVVKQRAANGCNETNQTNPFQKNIDAFLSPSDANSARRERFQADQRCIFPRVL